MGSFLAFLGPLQVLLSPQLHDGGDDPLCVWLFGSLLGWLEHSHIEITLLPLLIAVQSSLQKELFFDFSRQLCLSHGCPPSSMARMMPHHDFGFVVFFWVTH